MIKDEKLTSIIKRKKLSVDALGFETTRRCNLSCAHCLRGEPEGVDMDPRIPAIVMDQFYEIGGISLFGGEVFSNNNAIQVIKDEIKLRKLKLSYLTFITNLSYFADEKLKDKGLEGMELLSEIKDFLGKDFSVNIVASQDGYHVDEWTKKGYTGDALRNGYNEFKMKFPQMSFYAHYPESKKAFKILRMGRAKKLPDSNNFIPLPDRECLLLKSYWLDTLYMDKFFTDAKGNIVEPYWDYETCDNSKQNYGNVLTTPISEVIVNNGIYVG